MSVSAEFLIEPFAEGDPGPHVVAAVAILEDAGFPVEFGPFGTSISGEPADVLTSLSLAFDAAISKGASRVTLTLETDA